MSLNAQPVLAIIPARGGSKGIPRKNLIELNGKPLLAYTIEAAKGAKSISKVMLSSDDEDIISLSKSIGLYSSYRRPAKLATDESEVIESVIDLLQWIELHDSFIPETIVLLQPTSPLRTAEDIDLAVGFYLSNGLQSLTSVHKMREHPYDCIRGIGQEWSYLTEYTRSSNRRQDYKESFYYINGSIYIASLDFIKENRSFVNSSTFMYEIDAEQGLEIDELPDLYWAEFLLRKA